MVLTYKIANTYIDRDNSFLTVMPRRPNASYKLIIGYLAFTSYPDQYQWFAFDLVSQKDVLTKPIPYRPNALQWIDESKLLISGFSPTNNAFVIALWDFSDPTNPVELASAFDTFPTIRGVENRSALYIYEDQYIVYVTSDGKLRRLKLADLGKIPLTNGEILFDYQDTNVTANIHYHQEPNDPSLWIYAYVIGDTKTQTCITPLSGGICKTPSASIHALANKYDIISNILTTDKGVTHAPPFDPNTSYTYLDSYKVFSAFGGGSIIEYDIFSKTARQSAVNVSCYDVISNAYVCLDDLNLVLVDRAYPHTLEFVDTTINRAETTLDKFSVVGVYRYRNVKKRGLNGYKIKSIPVGSKLDVYGVVRIVGESL